MLHECVVEGLEETLGEVTLGPEQLDEVFQNTLLVQRGIRQPLQRCNVTQRMFHEQSLKRKKILYNQLSLMVGPKVVELVEALLLRWLSATLHVHIKGGRKVVGDRDANSVRPHLMQQSCGGFRDCFNQGIDEIKTFFCVCGSKLNNFHVSTCKHTSSREQGTCGHEDAVSGTKDDPPPGHLCHSFVLEHVDLVHVNGRMSCPFEAILRVVSGIGAASACKQHHTFS